MSVMAIKRTRAKLDSLIFSQVVPGHHRVATVGIALDQVLEGVAPSGNVLLFFEALRQLVQSLAWRFVTALGGLGVALTLKGRETMSHGESHQE
jgi:hypothetical protein